MAGQFSMDDLAASVTANSVSMADLQHLKSIGIVDQSKSIADVLGLSEYSWFVRLVASAGHWGGLQKTSREIGNLFKLQGARTQTISLNNIKDCSVLIDSANNWFWVCNGQLLPLFSDGNGGHIVQYQGANYAPITLNGNHFPRQIQPHIRHVFCEEGVTHFDAEVQKVMNDVCYVNDAGELETARVGSYLVGYMHNRKWNWKRIDAVTFAAHCKPEIQMASEHSNNYFIEKLDYTLQKSSVSIGRFTAICDMFKKLAQGTDIGPMPNALQRLTNRMTNTVGFTAFDVEQKPTSVFTSGEYQYAVAGPNGNVYNKARFGIEVAKNTGLILLAYITVDNTDIIDYRQGDYMQIS